MNEGKGCDGKVKVKRQKGHVKVKICLSYDNKNMKA